MSVPTDNLCERCEEREKSEGVDYCEECLDYLAEQAWERSMEDGETFRGGEAAAYNAEQQAWIQRNLK